jgi:hypothetical protein
VEITSIRDFLQSDHVFPSDKKILVTSFISNQHTHFASELQIVDELLEEGYKVAILQCGAELPSCFSNVSHLKSNCVACVSTNKSAYKKFENSRLSFIQLSSFSSEVYDKVQPGYLEEAFENGSYHSTIAFSKDSVISSPENKHLFERNVESSRGLYAQLSKLLDKEEIAAIITFNGRFSESRVCLEIGKLRNLPTYCHETSGTGKTFRIFKELEAHGREYHKSCVSALVEDLARRSELLEQGEFFFANQRKRSSDKIADKGVYSDRFLQGSLPADLIPGKHNISFFLTSEDEQSGLEDWTWPFGDSQYEVIGKLIPGLIEKNYEIWIRVHPNLAGRVNNSQINEIAKLQQPHVHIIAAEDEVDSYALIAESSNVIVFGSTVGLESTYMGVNTILLGRSVYEHLDVNRVPISLDDFPNCLNKEVSTDNRLLATLVAAYFLKEYNEFNNLLSSGDKRFLIRNGTAISPRIHVRIFYRLLRLVHL